MPPAPATAAGGSRKWIRVSRRVNPPGNARTAKSAKKRRDQRAARRRFAAVADAAAVAFP